MRKFNFVYFCAAVGLLCGVVGPSASAGTTVTIKGGGWGHGIGMSQYGAYGRALNGRSAAEILEHYYSGAKVSQADMPGAVRVGLLQGRASIAAESRPPLQEGGGTVVFKVAGSAGRIASGGQGSNWRVEVSPTGGMRLYKNGEQIKKDGQSVFGDPAHALLMVFEKYGSLVGIPDKDSSSSAKDANYAYGRIELSSYESSGFKLRLVLSLPMQKYLYGLGEVPASWPGAVLRAQAIAGRTYAYEKHVRLGSDRYPCGCTVYDSTVDQAYTGDRKRTGSLQWWDDWQAAVDDTKDQIVAYQGAPIQALYSSSSGGHTENNENVWGGTPIPYLRGVKDKPDAVDANPNHTWQVQMSWSDFASKLQSYYNDESTTRFGSLEDFKLVPPFGVSDRVTVVKAPDAGGVRIAGSEATIRVDGWSVRSALSLRDTLFRVNVTYDVAPKLEGKYAKLNGAPGQALGPAYNVPKQRDTRLGVAQDFVHGRLTWNKATDRVLWQRGVILDKYDSIGRERSPLGMPVSDVWGEVGNYRGATYVNGSIYWSQETGAQVVRGPFRVTYRRVGGVEGPLRLPVSGRQTSKMLPNGGKRQRFQHGSLYLNPVDNEVFALWSKIDVRYRAMGEASGACGYPTSDLVVDEAGEKASFEKGEITWTQAGGIVVDCGG